MSEPAAPASDRRASRSAVKKINYAKEQEFSDAEDNIFEDSAEEEPVVQRKSRGRPRKSTSKANAAAATATITTTTTISAHADQEDHDDDGDYGAYKPIFTEKGYDPSLAPIRERFHFLPEYEEDGSPKIDLIVGRRPVDEKEDVLDEENTPAVKDSDDDEEEEEEASEELLPVRGGRKTRKGSAQKAATTPTSAKKKGKGGSPNKVEAPSGGPVEYEYLVKYKGRSYLHLEWKTGADLESMNKSAKGIYRRYLKKVVAATEEDIENPEVDASYILPEKVIDEADQEITVELTDNELLRWEKQREKEIAEEEDDDDDAASKKNETPKKADKPAESKSEEKEEEKSAPIDDWTDTELDFKTLTIEKLRSILDRDGPYYPTVEGSTNAYRDGYIKEPPKKPRASYIFFQCSMRSYFQKKNPGAPQSELMSILGHQWQSMSEEERAPFLQLANEESKQHEKEKALKERAQRPTEVWQPIRRCHMVLDRLAADSFADIFLEPVNPDEFPDYEDLIDTAMDLGTVRTKLAAKKYQAPEQFARDMRKIWNNCKIYNQHGSAIWHVADYMSKQFERLYHAWVLEFRERYLRWSDPRARPWEHTCRIHDGTCGTTDEQMVLCDHCDGMYGIKCLTPSLKKIPKKAWHCTDCKPKLKSAKGLRMLSAVAENAARKRAELGDLPKKKVKQVMYLVKWAGLGYEHCTWETREDVNDDALLGVYHRLNSTFPGEPDLPEEVLEKYLGDTKHLNIENAGGTSCVPVLRSQLYAQSRAFQFSKFGMEFPDGLGSECGPRSKAALVCHPVCSNEHPREVVECVNDLVSRVSRKEPANRIRGNTSLPPPMTGEYDAIVPITSKGLMMNVGEIHGSVAFLGYRQFPDGTRGPAEIANLIRSVGDKIIAVDGGSTVGKSFKEVIMMLRESGKNKFAFMRFLENKYAVCENDLASVGTKGKYAIEELQKKFTTDRQRMLVRRKLVEDEVDDAAVNEREQVDRGQKDSDDESAAGSEGEFQPESDDEDLIVTGTAKEVSPSAKAKPSAATAVPPEGEKVPGLTPDIVLKEEEKNSNEVQEVEASPRQVDLFLENAEPQRDPGILYPQETTRSLAYRLLGTDVGYTSDEGGDDDCAFYLDGVDETFTNMNELADIAAAKNLESKGKTGKEDVVSTTIPAYQNEFSTKGDRGKLATAVALTSQQPCPDDFDHFPYPSSKEIEANKKLEEARLLAIESTSPSKSAKRSTVKVEQVSIATNEPVHVWANVEAIAATLQLPIIQLKQVLLEDYDEDIGDELGGFKWRYALAGAKVTAGNDSNSRGGGGKKAKAAWLEFRDKLYDPNVPYNYKNGNRLRDYQVDGVNWLASTWYKRQGCILADEMGLGKTVQIVCYIEHLFRVEKIKRPFLVVVPLSTVEHWRREFEGWTDMVCCVYHDRQRVWRDVMREYEWYYEDRPHTAEFLKFDVLVTTYDTLIGDFDVIGQIPFRVSVVDEAHRLRNQKGKLLECMREISAKGTMQYGFQSRVLMSGTPLQNDLTELWTLLNFIEPFRFPDLAHFQLNFGNMANREQVEALQKMISPCMLRRVKEDVAKDIPSKEETLIDVELTAIQKQYYRAIFEHNHAFLSMGSTRQTAPKLMNIQMELRKVCNHPFLIDGVEHKETERQFKEFSDKGAFEGKTPEMQQYMLNEHGYVMNSGKMVLLDKLLPKLRQEGHKILIFSQMVRMLDLISEYCDFREFRYERLDGRVRGTERQKAIDRFEREEDSFLFLLSTRAGGVGINLTAADVCIIFDSDWNPQNDVQAQARCHRIGQTKDVRIYRLITSRSFEQEMFDRASRKLGLEQAVLGTFEKDRDDDKPTQKEMEQLLKKGAYALLDDENDEITREFCADDIESILAKRTRTRVVEGAKTATWLNKQGMMVSKTKFSAESGGSALDMDDPLFWQKVMPDFVTPNIMQQKLNDLQDDIEGTSTKGPGRGRGRKKKTETEGETPGEDDGNKTSSQPDDAAEEVDPDGGKEDDAENGEAMDVDDLMADETLEELPEEENGDEEVGEAKSKTQLSRTNVRKIHKFMGDLKSMMESLFVEADEDGISADDKACCQKLLLTISMKEKMFNDEQRRLARAFLKRLEGDRKRRCRTSEQPRFKPGEVFEDEVASAYPEELMIVGKKRKKRRKRSEIDEAESGPGKKRRRRETTEYVGEDGYLHHSDSEADWSDVGEDLYMPTKKDKISRKEARRRRQWSAGDDPATAAGLPWPAFPRNFVKRVLTTILEEVMKHDKENGGVFSEHVSRKDFPEYYEQIKTPMDYETMQTKLENDEYRSAQSMQKDFVLILQNCRKFNATTSDIVKEAREQHLLRPKILMKAAEKHDLFLGEDGSVLEIVDEIKKGSEKKKKRRRRKKEEDGEEPEAVAGAEDGTEDTPASKKKRKGKKSVDDDEGKKDEGKKKTRIRIKVQKGPDEDPGTPSKTTSVKKPGKRRKSVDSEEYTKEADVGKSPSVPIPKKKRKKSEGQSKKKKSKKPKEEAASDDEDQSAPAEEDVVEATVEDSASADYLDVSFWKKEREALDDSFDAARSLLTRFGPWTLPTGVAANKFADVAKATIAKMNKHDRYSVFADSVSDSDAPGYSEVVNNPMDFGTMMTKADKRAYGRADAAAALYEDFLLVFDNCRLYNPDDSEVAEEAARILALLPESYAAACVHAAKKNVNYGK